ncbi:HIT family protein [Aliiglaciecola sp. CAU 1673]|uniref:HIT domain-containing protein n=1 Tax=Aliiglaciecola sp. CAU 1673 TaxID=3032595 RepID=UPI0023DBB921|nr:HIT family protein [Aliiglaciecola sp. CAU 1673]MDF2180028.1 HIT family protein [Aliiglaciecola sp. CAU 1673]
MFQLHPQLQKDCFEVIDLPLCKVLLMNDSQYPWTILVPKVEGIREIIELSNEQQSQLWLESAQLSHALMSLFSPHKLNMAALGNMVPQLHIHHIARYENDPAWPAPVWGKHPAQAYGSEEAKARIEALQKILA